MSRRSRDSTHRQGGFSLSGFGEGGAKKSLPSFASSIVACSCHLTGNLLLSPLRRRRGKVSLDSLRRKCEESVPKLPIKRVLTFVFVIVN